MGAAVGQQQHDTQQQQQQQQQPGGGVKKKKSKVASVISGSVSGALVSACLQPMDVIRTRMQADVVHGAGRSTVATTRAIMLESGVRALWRGTQPTVIRLAFGAGLHFFFLETIKPLFERRQGDGSAGIGAMGAMITGGLSRTLAAVAACPITLVKTRMEYVGAGGHAYRGTLHALGEIWRAEGLRGMYRGIGPTALSQAPFSALYYMFYTQLQDRLKGGERPSVAVNFVSGTLAGMAATMLTQPADVIRTRMQLDLSGAAGDAGAAAAQANTLQVFRQIAGQQGMRGLLVGAAPRVVKRTLQTALLWTLYEELYPALSRAGEALHAHIAAAAEPSPTSPGSSGGRRPDGGGDRAAG